MMRARLLALAALPALACYPVKPPDRSGLASFEVRVAGLFAPGTTNVLPVATPCAQQYGSQALVPADQRGTPACPYLMPRGAVDVSLSALALDTQGAVMADFNGPVSFRAVPGDLAGGYLERWAQAKAGKAELATFRVSHLYGEVRFWAEDAPPAPIYDGGQQILDSMQLPVEPERRSFATGLSAPVFFEDPTIAKVQIPDGFDNRSSPLVGQFLTIGRDPQGGVPLTQSCSDDPEHDGRPVAMVVTGTDPSGFFVTDLSACRMKEQLKDGTSTVVRVPEPSGYLPGAFGGLFVYNYSYPEGLNAGDLLFTLSGAVQEFTSTTQLVFPAWTIAEKVRELPTDQWDKWLKLVKPYELSLRTCGLDNQAAPFVTDALCGHNRRNLKLESLESSLVKVRNVRFPQVFTQCDLNADGTVPFFCESKFTGAGCPTACADPTPYCNPALQKCVADEWGWRDCNFGGESEPANDTAERTCLIKCVTGQEEWKGKMCSEKSTFVGFGQFVVEMAGPGPAEAGLDPSLPVRSQVVALGAASTALTTGYRPGTQVRIWCSGNARYKAGDAAVAATAGDTALPSGTLLEHTFEGTQSHLAFLADGTVPAAANCTVAENTHTLLNVITKDAVPDLQPDCRIDDPVADKAEQCRALRAATYDIVGHLRHVQPARPRWLILPRDADDLCCHPGPGLSCPRPLKPCP